MVLSKKSFMDLTNGESLQIATELFGKKSPVEQRVTGNVLVVLDQFDALLICDSTCRLERILAWESVSWLAMPAAMHGQSPAHKDTHYPYPASQANCAITPGSESLFELPSGIPASHALLIIADASIKITVLPRSGALRKRRNCETIQKQPSCESLSPAASLRVVEHFLPRNL